MEPPLISIDDVYVLDRWRASDSDALRRFDLDPAAARFFGWTVEAARRLPHSHYDGPTRERANLEDWREGKRLSLAIRRSVDGEAVGWVELRPSEEQVEVSYMVSAELRGQQLAPRALTRFLSWASEALCLQRAVLLCDRANIASQRVADRTGFVLTKREGEELRYEREI